MTIKELSKLANKLGYGKLTSYQTLWNSVINTFGKRDASMWFLTIQLNDDDKVVGIEINTTYFKATEQIKKINKVANFDNPISVAEAIELI
jgi:hypothetical protein